MKDIHLRDFLLKVVENDIERRVLELILEGNDSESIARDLVARRGKPREDGAER